MQTVIDAGPLVALLDHRDQHHSWAREVAHGLRGPLHTCEAVVSEAHFLLRRSPPSAARLNELIVRGRVVASFRAEDHSKEIAVLMERYANIPMSYADACLVRLSEYPESRVFTIDAGFEVFRTTTGKRIHLLIP